MQTGDIQLASTQLNHKGVAVTAAFYAELQKEKQKEKNEKLSFAEDGNKAYEILGVAGFEPTYP